MLRTVQFVLCFGLTVVAAAAHSGASEIRGHYIEARTCQVYTGPCFANGEVGLGGKDAVMAWNIQTGRHHGIDLSGMGVALVVLSSDTLGHRGLNDARELRAMIVVDRRASLAQHEALVDFAKSQTGGASVRVETIRSESFAMHLDEIDLTAKLQVGDLVRLQARKARPGDCICSNESAFYPPLAKLQGSVPGVTIDGRVKAPGLGTRWSIPDSRTAYIGTFSVQ